jgi:DNA polymerase-3 subunit gamma/tau
LRDALSIFDQMVAFTGNHLTYKAVVENLHVLDFDYYFRITNALLNQRLPEIMLTFDDILRKGFDGHNFINGLGEHLRNVMVSKDPQTVQLLEISENLKPKYAQQAADAPLPFLLKALAIISKTDVNYKGAKNQRLLVEMALMQMAYLNTASPVDAEKKNDVEPAFEVKKPSLSPVSSGVSSEKQVKTSEKPVVPFSELKIKAQFSLNQAAKGNAAVAEVLTETITETYENQAFTYEALTDVIRSFAEMKNQKGNRQLFATLTASKIELDETNLVSLNIHNEAQKEILVNVRQEFLDYIRKELQNNTVNLQIRITDELPPAAKAYKPAYKFKLLSEKNPALLDLKKRLDLEIDY